MHACESGAVRLARAMSSALRVRKVPPEKETYIVISEFDEDEITARFQAFSGQEVDPASDEAALVHEISGRPVRGWTKVVALQLADSFGPMHMDVRNAIYEAFDE